jgi:hypothetical protein
MNPLSEYPIDAHELRHPPLPKNAPLKGSSLLGSVAARRARQWALGLIVVAIVAASAAFGGATPTPCYEAYRMSGFNPQQMSFEEFRGLYDDTPFCAPGGEAR